MTEKDADNVLTSDDMRNQRFEELPRRTQFFQDPRKQYEHDLDQIWKFYNKGCEGYNEGQPVSAELKKKLEAEYGKDSVKNIEVKQKKASSTLMSRRIHLR